VRTTAPTAAIKYALRLRIIVRVTIIHPLTLLAIVLLAAATVSEVTARYIREGHVHILQHKEIPSYVSIFTIHGPFLFGATDKLDTPVSRLYELPPIIMLRLRNMTAIDSTRSSGNGKSR
jgi:SulP family sulfate permease